jgi:outer membrane biosynthesis protein TonB
VVTASQESGNPQGTNNQAEQSVKEQNEQTQDNPTTQSETDEQESESGGKDDASIGQNAADQELSPKQEEPHDTPENSFEESQQQIIDPMSGISPLIAQAEAIINDSGSSWITQSQKKSQPYTNTTSTGIKTTHHTDAGGSITASGRTDKARKTLTLADITRSYVKQVHKEQNETGHYTYNKTGAPLGASAHGVYAPPTSGVALSEQLYASKLYNLLDQSAQAYSNQIYSCSDLDMQTVIEVTIEKSGKILDVTLNPAIPEKDMERALCLIVKKVGLFPPIPREFHKQRIILSIPIHIRSKQGFASYRLLYGLNTV